MPTPSRPGTSPSDEVVATAVSGEQILRRTDFHAAIRANKRATVYLCVFLVLLGGGFGYLIGWLLEVWLMGVPYSDPVGHTGGLPLYTDGAMIGLGAMTLVSLIWIAIALGKGDRIMLRMVGAEPAPREEYEQLHNVVEEMAIAAGLPTPQIDILDSDALNAFATGLRSDKATICVTRGLLETLSRDELQGVVAHEVSHILNDDCIYATMVAVLVGLVALVSDSLLLGLRHGPRQGSGKGKGNALAFVVLMVVIIVAPLAAKLVQMSISRQREYLADATAVKLTRNPKGLIGALRKIAGTDRRFAGANRAVQHLFIANPFRDFGAKASALMSTHPPLADRIRRLADLA